MQMAEKLAYFLDNVKSPFVVVGALKAKDREAVAKFLPALNAPVYLEGISGLREDPSLDHLKIRFIHNLWKRAAGLGYSIDGLLRIGGVPTCRPWRDLEDMQGKVRVCSVSHLPFSGLSWGEVLTVDLVGLFSTFGLKYNFKDAQSWIESDRQCYQTLLSLFIEEPSAEPSLFFELSRCIPQGAMVYLGNSLPIREWDLAASYENRAFDLLANRGLNGIDGQVSTFLGLCKPGRENWGIVGDLTMLYDMAGPWIWEQLEGVSFTLVVVNNGGGKIFSSMFSQMAFQNPHGLDFRALAEFWHLPYERWTDIPEQVRATSTRLVELIPDEAATKRFWDKYRAIEESSVGAFA